MSKSGKTASEKAPGGPQSDSVYDFLYCDWRRIGSFLAQFDDSGHLEKVIQREAVAKTAKRGFEINVGGGGTLAGTGGSANLAVKRGPVEEGSEGSERIYDPLWSNARQLLDYLQENNLIVRDIADASIGQFTIMSGELTVIDVSTIKTILESPAIRTHLQHELSKAPTTRKVKDIEKKRAEHMSYEASLSILGRLPNSLQATIESSNAKVWFSLAAHNVVGDASDLIIKHGAKVDGRWNVIGILDASIDTEPQQQTTPIPDVQSTDNLPAMAKRMAPWIRRNLGRPYGAFGMTPLMIFREVTGQSRI